MADEDCCFIGLPLAKKKSSSIPGPSTSRIGGLPTFWDESTVPRLDEIQCKACHSSTNMCLVAQLYAPITDYDRSLYVFCCNKRLCSLSSAGWIVLRNQTTKLSKEDVQLPTIPAPVVVAPAAASVWGSWSLDSEGMAADNDDDLEALLAARDNANHQQQMPLPQVQVKNQPSHRQSVDHNDENHLSPLAQALASLGHELSCWEIESSADPFDYATKSYYKSGNTIRTKGVADNNENSDDSDDDVPMTVQERQHIDRMLQGYVADEEDTSIIALLQQELSGSSDLKRQTVVTNNGATTATAVVRDDTEDMEDADDDEIDDDLHDKLLDLVREHDNKLKKQEQQNKHKKTKKQKPKISTKKNGTRKRK